MTAKPGRAFAAHAEALDILACDCQLRPKGAPSFFDLEDAVRGVRREDGALLIDFDAAAAEHVAALVDAERQCCASIGWELQTAPTLRLRISATAPQLDVFEGFLPTGRER